MAQPTAPTESNPPASIPQSSPTGFQAGATPTSPQPSPKKSRTVTYVVIGIIVVVVLVVAVLALAGTFSPKSSSPSGGTGGGGGGQPPAQDTIVTSGTVWNLNAGYYEDVGPADLTSNSSWTVTGSFTASHSITAYVMTSGEYSAWGGSGKPSSYFWTSGPSVNSGSVNTNLPANDYYFVWDNTNYITSTSVQITSNVVATASG
jgi:hypothetical protein